MNNRDKQVIKKILSEIEVIEQLITGFDVTAHKYQTLKMGDVWYTVKQDMPVLKAQLASIIKY